MSKTYIKDVTHFKKIGIKKPFKPYQPPPRPEAHLKPWEKAHIPHKRVDESYANMLFAKIKAGKYSDIMEFMSKTNTTLNITDKEGNSALHILLDGESNMEEAEILELVTYLVKHGVNPGGYSKKNVTPLHLAAKMQYSSIVKFLLESGVSANVTDSQGMTPLHYVTLGLITECKKKKRVGALIPAEKGVTKVTKGELRDVTLNIIAILAQPKFNQFNKHIRNTLKYVGDIYPESIIKKYQNFISNVSGILSDKGKSDTRKKEEIEGRISNMLADTKLMLENKLSTSTNKMVIMPNQTNGWGPKSATDVEKILPYKSVINMVEDIKNSYEMEKLKVLDGIDETYNTIKQLSLDIDKDKDTIINKLYHITLLNVHAIANYSLIEGDYKISVIDDQYSYIAQNQAYNIKILKNCYYTKIMMNTIMVS
jgi:hypothetical protein